MATTETVKYNSNPFTLTFHALGNFFNANLVWVVVAICFEVFGWLMQVVSSIIDAISKSESASYTSTSSASFSSSSSDPNIALLIVIVLICLAFFAVMVAVASVVGTYITGMFSYVALKSQEGKKVGLGEAFNAVTKRFWRLFLAQLLAGLKIVGGLFLFIIPGIRAALRYSILPYVIMSEPESQKAVGASHDRTKNLVKGRLMEPFGVYTVSSLIPFVGTSLGFAGSAALYQQLAHYHDSKLEKPKVHWLNYIGLIIFGAFLLFALLIGFMVFALSTIS